MNIIGGVCCVSNKCASKVEYTHITIIPTQRVEKKWCKFIITNWFWIYTETIFWVSLVKLILMLSAILSMMVINLGAIFDRISLDFHSRIIHKFSCKTQIQYILSNFYQPNSKIAQCVSTTNGVAFFSLQSTT